MTAVVRALDLLALGLALAVLGALATWWTRPENLFLALLGIVALRLWLAPVAVPALAPRRVVAAGVLAYSVVFSFVTVTRHLAFRTHALDLGYYVQLASDPILYSHRTQYQSFVLPFLMLAAIGGFARLARRSPGRRPATVVVLAMLLSLGLAARPVNDLALERWWPTAERRAVHALLARIPATAAVSVQDPYAAHLSLRRQLFVFPVEIDRADRVLLNEATYPWRNLPGVSMTREGATVVITLLDGRERRYAVEAETGPHWLLRRR